MAKLNVSIQSVDSDALVQAQVDAQKPAPGADMLDYMINYLQEIQRGRKAGSTLTISAVNASASVDAVLDTVVADDTLVVGVVTLTAKAMPSGENEFAVGGTDVITATNLAACINAHSVLSLVVSASDDGAGTVTITSLEAGTAGNQILVSGASTMGLSGAALSGGDETNTVYLRM